MREREADECKREERERCESEREADDCMRLFEVADGITLESVRERQRDREREREREIVGHDTS